MSEFIRESRYITIKLSKCSNSQKFKLTGLLDDYASACVDCIVIEKDWPEYEIVWKMLEDRITKENS